MKTKEFKLIAILSSLLIVFSGCKHSNDKDGEKVDPTPEKTFTPIKYETNGIDIKDYKIVIPQAFSSVFNYAASELQAYIKKATNYELEIINDSVAEQQFEIILGNSNRNEVANIDFSKLGEESFVIKNVGNDLVIGANNKRGILYGVYSYLEALGYRYYTATLEKIPEAYDVFVPNDINIEWTPTMWHRDTMFKVAWDPVFAVKQKINHDFQRNELKNNAKYGGFSGYIGGGRYLVHTFKYLLPAGTYRASHPEWYAQNVGTAYSTDEYIQPCFSNYDSIDVVMASVDALIANDPTASIISISQNDGGKFCKCEKCNAAKEKYNESGVMLLYINKIAKKIKEKYPHIKVDTLAYDWSLEAPKDVIAEDNIIVRFCTEMCPFHDDSHRCETLNTKEQYFLDWQSHASEFSVWTYPITWSNLFNCWPNYYELKSHIAFFVKHGVKAIYQEGIAEDSCEFPELKAYVLAKLAAYPEMSDEEFEYHISDFMEAYYGQGWKHVRDYLTYAHERILENVNTFGCYTTHISTDNLFDFKWDGESYDMDFINKMNSCWEKAMDAVNEEEFKHVEKSSLHWIYIELYTTFDKRYLKADRAEMDELEERNRNLYHKLKEYGTVYKYDNKTINMNVTNFKSSPMTW